MFGVANIVCRSDETNPAAEIPRLVAGYRDNSSLATPMMVLVRELPPAFGVSSRWVANMVPCASTTPPKTLVPPMSIPMLKLSTREDYLAMAVKVLPFPTSVQP